METQIQRLGEAIIDFPLPDDHFVDNSQRVLYHVSHQYFVDCVKNNRTPISFELAGPRNKIYFDPKKLKCAIVTCGGLCPGLNDVIRGVVMALYHMYGVRNILGIRYGYEGFIPRYGHDLLELSPDKVDGIHDIGGTILGSSRGHQEIGDIVDAIERLNLGILFTIGGDGTLRAAESIDQEMRRRQLKCAVAGIPKTIDNDIRLAARSFGFETAVEEATKAIGSAHVEARGAPNGVGLVKLMGRHAGFIAATAALAQPDVNVVLVPELDFDLEGGKGLFGHLRERLEKRGHAVHGSMAGKTGFMVSIWNNNYIYVPIKEAISTRKQIDLKEKLWVHVTESTGQPSLVN
jgi:6-phosphofructokinase 1